MPVELAAKNCLSTPRAMAHGCPFIIAPWYHPRVVSSQLSERWCSTPVHLRKLHRHGNQSKLMQDWQKLHATSPLTTVPRHLSLRCHTTFAYDATPPSTTL